jgi:hypothetical protein
MNLLVKAGSQPLNCMIIELIADLSLSLSRIAHVVGDCWPSDDVENGDDVFMIREHFP